MTTPNFRPDDTEWRVMQDMNKRLTAIEERLAKLEGCSMTPEDKADIRADHVAMGIDLAKQPPKVCPVSGMFLEEPEKGTLCYSHWGCLEEVTWLGHEVDKQFLADGNLFATREDAERYAKHLKAMAKLRRVDKHGGARLLQTTEHGDMRLLMVIDPKAYWNLTPEEQNALLWPNEEKQDAQTMPTMQG